jgi:cob(I)alamin adenosyltransferase
MTKSICQTVFHLIDYNSPMPIFFTRTGDDGTTSLLGDGRISKTHPRIETLGSLDEATAAFGLARAFCQDVHIQQVVMNIQRDLYHMMTEIAAPGENVENFRALDDLRVSWLESQVETLSSQVQVPHDFIIPGNTQSGASFSIARTAVRKAERRLVELQEINEIKNPCLLQYINRLSSLCFILELNEDQTHGKKTNLAKDKK